LPAVLEMVVETESVEDPELVVVDTGVVLLGPPPLAAGELVLSTCVEEPGAVCCWLFTVDDGIGADELELDTAGAGAGTIGSSLTPLLVVQSAGMVSGPPETKLIAAHCTRPVSFDTTVL